MKKIILIAFLGSISLMSCKKDYTCRCVETGSGYEGEDLLPVVAKKGDADAECDKFEANAYKADDSHVRSCEIQ